MPNIETAKQYSDRVVDEYVSSPLPVREVLLQNTIARDAAIRAESADAERDALKAQVAELEARLQEAADRAVAWQKKLCKADDWSCENCTECADLRAAIVGKKEG